MIEAELPDGTILEFPDGTDPGVVQRAVKKQLGVEPGAPPEPDAASESPPRAADIMRGRVSARAIEARQEAGGFRAPLTLSDVAREAGVGTEGAGAAARFNINLASGADPQEQLDIARRALERDLGRPVQVRMGPETKELEFRPEGGDSFTLVNKPGIDFADFAAAAPETGVFAAGATGAVAGAATGGAIFGGSPFMMFAGAAGGEAIGEGVAEYGRLLAARDRGIIDATDDEIFDMAAKRAGIAGGSAVVGGALLSAFRRVVTGTFRMDPDTLLSAGGGEALETGEQAVRPVQEAAEAATGRRLPVTAGQQSGAPQALRGEEPTVSGEALRGEEAARTFRNEGQGLRDIDAQQERVVTDLEAETFGPRAPERVSRGGRAVQQTMTEAERRALAPGTERVARSEQDLAGTQEAIGAQARQPEAAVTAARDNIGLAREEVFEPFRRQFDDLQAERGIKVDLGGFRARAKAIETREGQKILESISLQSQSRLLKEAGQAGQKEVEKLEIGPDNLFQMVKRLGDEPASLGEVQRALRDIRRELRRPGIADEPQKERLLKQLRDSLRETRDRALSPEDRDRVLALEATFAQASDRFDRGIVGEITNVNQFGRPVLSGDDALNRLLRNQRNASEFVSAVSDMPGGGRIMTDIQDAVLGRIDRQFIDEETGELAVGRLETFLRNNREALDTLFAGRKDMLKAIKDARSAGAAVKRNKKQLEEVRKAFGNRFGVFSADPAVIVPNLMQQGGTTNLKAARDVLRRRAPSRVAAFDEAIAEQARQQILGDQQRLTADGIHNFLRTEPGRVVSEVLGDKFRSNLTTLRDVLRIVDQRAPGRTPTDITNVFQRGVPGLQGLARFSRIIAPPLSKRGRALTATVGAVSERSRRRIADLLADPKKLSELARLKDIDPGSSAGRVILGRLGFGHVLDMMEE